MAASESQGVQSAGIQNQNIILVLFQGITIIVPQLFSSCARQDVLVTPSAQVCGAECHRAGSFCGSFRTLPFWGSKRHPDISGNVYWNNLLQLGISEARCLWEQLHGLTVSKGRGDFRQLACVHRWARVSKPVSHDFPQPWKIAGTDLLWGL